MRVLILGAGGHAQVVADILLRARQAGGELLPIGYLDDNPRVVGSSVLGLPVVGSISQLSAFGHDAVVVAIGDNSARARIYTDLAKAGETIVSAIHPRAVLAPDVQVGDGVVICAGVVINTGSVVGPNAILNTACTVDHHSQIGAHAHIAPGVHLGGEVQIGAGALVGIGAAVIPRCTIGEWAIVGAGAVVTEDIPPRSTAVGVPAKVIKRQGRKG